MEELLQFAPPAPSVVRASPHPAVQFERLGEVADGNSSSSRVGWVDVDLEGGHAIGSAIIRDPRAVGDGRRLDGLLRSPRSGCADPEERAEYGVSGGMKRTAGVLLLCAGCSGLPDTPAGTELLERQRLVARLHHGSAEELAPLVEEVLSARPPRLDDLKVAVQPGQNALVLVGTSEQIREGLVLLSRLDTPPSH